MMTGGCPSTSAGRSVIKKRLPPPTFSETRLFDNLSNLAHNF